MRDVVDGRHFVLDGVTRPLLFLSAVDKAVDRPRRRPHQIGTGLVIVGFFDCDGRVSDHRFHQPFHEAIQHIQIGLHIEIDLEQMRQDIRRAAGGLIRAYRVGIDRVEKGNFRQHVRIQPPQLVLCFGVGNNAARIHFRTRRRKRQHGDDGQARFDFPFTRGKFPRVAVVKRPRTDKFRRVDDRTAAYGQKHVYLFPAAEFRALAHGIHSRVRLDARKLEKLQPRPADFRRHAVVKPRLFDRAAAVGEQYPVAEAFELVAQMPQLVGAEIYLCGNVVNKTIHRTTSLK